MPNRKQWTRPITKDPETGDYILDLGEDVCRAAGLKPGDTVQWINNGDGSWTLKKKNNWLKNSWKNLSKLLKTLRAGKNT